MGFENQSSSSSSSLSLMLQLRCKPCNPSGVLPAQAGKKPRAGRKKFKETRHPVYKCVRQRNGDKWVCEVREPKKKTRIWLGTYPTAELAAMAHDVAALALRGNSAALNFPHLADMLPQVKGSSARELRTAALAATEACRAPAAMCSSPPSSCCASQENSGDLRASSTVNDKEKDSEDSENKGIEYQSEENDFSQPAGAGSLFLDEEALFNMPALLDSMAEGLIVTPPAMQRGYDWDDYMDTITLWTN